MVQHPKLRLRKLAHPGSLKSVVEDFYDGSPALGEFARACLQIVRPIRLRQPFAIEYNQPGQMRGTCGPFYFPRGFFVPEEICAKDELPRILNNEVLAVQSGVPLNSEGVLDAVLWHSRSGRDAWYRRLDLERCYANLQTLDLHAPGAIQVAEKCAELGFFGQKWRVIRSEIADKRAREQVVERLQKIKTAVGWDHSLSIDTQGSWSDAAALDFLHCLDDGLLDWIEDLDAEVIKVVPIADRKVRFSTGEKWSSYAEAKLQFRAECYSIVHPDAFVCGGVSELIRIAQLAQRCSILTIPHGRTLIESIVASQELEPANTIFFEFNPVIEPLRQMPFGRKCGDLFKCL